MLNKPESKINSLKFSLGISLVGWFPSDYSAKYRETCQKIKVEKMTQKCMPSIFEEIIIFTKNFEKGMYIHRHIAYISIENVCFPMILKGMITRKLAIKPANAHILMPNECLGDIY